MANIKCRHCGLPIKVPASKCPWCGEQIMVVCANCKAYTDDRETHCEKCGASLRRADMSDVVLKVRHPEIARMAEEREIAQMVASAVVLRNIRDFFYSGEGYKTVLVELFGPSHEPLQVAAGLLFCAYVYLAQHGYCQLTLRVLAEDEEILFKRVRPWDGQQSIEGALLAPMESAATTYETTRKMLHSRVGMRKISVPDRGLGAPKRREVPERSALAVIDHLARVTVLPERDDMAPVYRETYRALADFVEKNREQARLLAFETVQLLIDFEQMTDLS